MGHIVFWIHFRCMFKIHFGHRRVLLFQQNLAEQNKRDIHVRFKKDGAIQGLLCPIKVAGPDVSVTEPFVNSAIQRVEIAFLLRLGLSASALRADVSAMGTYSRRKSIRAARR